MASTFSKFLSMTVVVSLCGEGCLLMAQNTPQAFRWPNGKRVAVSLSFDDARESQMDTGLALFNRHGAKVTFYVNPPNMKSRIEQWKAAVAAGHEIGNHTTSHPCSGNFSWSRSNALENYTLAMIATQMDSANADIERLLDAKATTFAYPCGQKFIGRGAKTESYVPLVAKRFVVGRGFRDEAANDPLYCDLAQIFGIDSDGMTFDEMRDAIIAGEKEGGWVVFAGHEIGSGGQQTTRTDSLERLLQYAKDPAHGVWLERLDKVAAYINATRTRK